MADPTGLEVATAIGTIGSAVVAAVAAGFAAWAAKSASTAAKSTADLTAIESKRWDAERLERLQRLEDERHAAIVIESTRDGENVLLYAYNRGECDARDVDIAVHAMWKGARIVVPLDPSSARFSLLRSRDRRQLRLMPGLRTHRVAWQATWSDNAASGETASDELDVDASDQQARAVRVWITSAPNPVNVQVSNDSSGPISNVTFGASRAGMTYAPEPDTPEPVVPAGGHVGRGVAGDPQGELRAWVDLTDSRNYRWRVSSNGDVRPADHPSL